MKTVGLIVISAALLGGVAFAQTTPGSENTTNLAPKAQSHHHRHHKPKPATNTSSSATSSSAAAKPSSATSSAKPSNAAPQTTTANPQTVPLNPDQGKPGVPPKDDNTTNMHMPGSENPADTGPGAPKA